MINSSLPSSASSGFPREVIAVAGRWCLRYGLSYRDVEELLAERGIRGRPLGILTSRVGCDPDGPRSAAADQ